MILPPPKSAIPIVLMGTATFAIPTLGTLFQEGYGIKAVITQADKPSGRGQALQPPPIKRTALDLRLPVHQPKSLKNDEARALFESLAPALIVVVAYGKILPPWLIAFPQYGCINLHGSILPKYRGAAPVHWAIANGETKTGVCTMRLDEGLDTGPVFLCDETDIGPDETVDSLYDRLAQMGAGLMRRTVEGVLNGALQAVPQNHAEATYAPILKKEQGFIDWNMPARAIHNRVRAFNPWPGMVTKFRGSNCKILRTTVGQLQDKVEPGLIVTSKKAFAVVCGDAALLEILSIQPENRKPVSGVDFANGVRLQPHEKFQTVMDNGEHERHA